MQVERDYIHRLIRQIVLVLARILRLREREEVDQALRELHAAYGDLFPPVGNALVRLDAASTVALLDDPLQLLGLARLLHEEAELLNMRALPLEAAVLEARARELAAEALRQQPDLTDVDEVKALRWFDP